ncbi:hypothetical protein Hdeb2414_s0269g00852761 [Helianthus debilis subsp. tardiflorus]
MQLDAHYKCTWLCFMNSVCAKTKSAKMLLLDPMLSKTQGAGEVHRPRPKPRRKSQKKRGLFLRNAHIEKKKYKKYVML